MSAHSGTKMPPSKQLLTWLDEQVVRLGTLVTRGWKIQADYLQNAKQKGELLAEIRRRLEGTALAFDEWVKASTGIGVSTAYLWMEVAEWWDDIAAYLDRVAAGHDSNPLETSLRAIRSIVRSLRQARGLGKPGSGRRTGESTNGSVTHGDAGADHHTEIDDQNEDDADSNAPALPRPPESLTAASASEPEGNNTAGWERAIEEAENKTGSKKPVGTAGGHFTVHAVAADDADLVQIRMILPNPITTTTKGLVSVKSWVARDQIDQLLLEVGKALKSRSPKKLRLSIEL